MTTPSPLDLRGRSLAGAQLASASFAGSDVRGADFTGADLRDANLSHIRSGMSRGWATLLVLGSLLLSIVLGVLIAYCSNYLLSMYASDDVRYRMSALFVISALLVFLAAGVWKGLHYAIYSVLPVTAALAVAAGLSAVATGTGTGAIALLTVIFLALAVVVIELAVLVRATAGAVGKLGFMLVAVAGSVAAGEAGGGVFAAAIAIAAMVMARRSARVDGRYPTLSRLIESIACRGGTHFRNADLRGANLEHARLFASDLRGARLEGARLDHATFHLCRLDRPGLAK